MLCTCTYIQIAAAAAEEGVTHKSGYYQPAHNWGACSDVVVSSTVVCIGYFHSVWYRVYGIVCMYI